MKAMDDFWNKYFKSYGDTDFVTGMRAFAAIAVVVIHSGGAGLRDMGWYGSSLVDLCAMGPCVFFVISGYSISASYNQASGFPSFIKKRMLRIVPLYYFWIILFAGLMQGSSWWAGRFGVPIDWYNFVMHFSFLSFTDYRIANSMLGVEWSLPIEVFWYMFFPIIMFSMRSGKTAFPMLILAWIIFILTFYIMKNYIVPINGNAYTAYFWSPIPYFFSYCAGVVAYRIRQARKFSGFTSNVILILSVILLLSLPRIEQLGQHVSDYIMNKYIIFSLISMVIIAVGSRDGFLFRVFLFNRVSVFLGVISYGLYLSHPVVIYLLEPFIEKYNIGKLSGFALVLFFTILVSTITYVFVERWFTAKIYQSINRFCRNKKLAT